MASLAVKPGEAVAENDPLFSLSLEDLQQKLEETELELEKLNLDIRDQKSREKTEAVWLQVLPLSEMNSCRSMRMR